jgi:hypothetical protein
MRRRTGQEPSGLRPSTMAVGRKMRTAYHDPYRPPTPVEAGDLFERRSQESATPEDLVAIQNLLSYLGLNHERHSHNLRELRHALLGHMTASEFVLVTWGSSAGGGPNDDLIKADSGLSSTAQTIRAGRRSAIARGR